MAQHDYTLDNQDGASFRADLNAALAAILSGNSGPTEPAVMAPLMLWLDTSTNTLRQRNLANTAWVAAASPEFIAKQPGDTIQVAASQTGAVATGTATIPLDDTIPQITEGTEFMTASITPTRADSILQIEVVFFASNSTGAGTMIAALFRDADANALACGAQVIANSGVLTGIKFTHRVLAGATSPTTFRVRAGFSTAATVTFNGSLGARLFGGVFASSITITEIKA